MDDKYMTYKRDEMSAWLLRLAKDLAALHIEAINDTLDAYPTELDDSVVIRTRDTFAAPGLYAYAWSMQTLIETLRQEAVSGITPLDESMIDRLDAISHYFFDRANEAETAIRDGRSKLPD